jgi:hypothetical protein
MILFFMKSLFLTGLAGEGAAGETLGRMSAICHGWRPWRPSKARTWANALEKVAPAFNQHKVVWRVG